MELKVRNVNEAFERLVDLFHRRTPIVREGRFKNPNGEGAVLYIPEPVTLTYERPWERVLLNSERDANPFFHLYESLWMLAGRNDAAPLNYYTSGIGKYSDDGHTMNGAYGYRWRHGRGQWAAAGSGTYQRQIDQLEVIINHLKVNPHSRRAVLSMWNVQDDTEQLDTSRDVCCNLDVMFSIREEYCAGGLPEADHWTRYLDMTVTNRSNDLVLGMLGANAVHFSFLQEYMARRIEVEIGVYHQFSNNVHVYLNDQWRPREWLVEYKYRDMWSHPALSWDSIQHVQFDASDEEITKFVNDHSGKTAETCSYESEFLQYVARPMMLAYHAHRRGHHATKTDLIHQVRDDAWRRAGAEWLKRRNK